MAMDWQSELRRRMMMARGRLRDARESSHPALRDRPANGPGASRGTGAGGSRGVPANDVERNRPNGPRYGGSRGVPDQGREPRANANGGTVTTGDVDAGTNLDINVDGGTETVGTTSAGLATSPLATTTPVFNSPAFQFDLNQYLSQVQAWTDALSRINQTPMPTWNPDLDRWLR